ncbi:MAG: ABC transporter ATP-binding protein [Planctomycetota bacterium]|jgi:oligopeptide/dipeptide ABC transporter ATP-binding protein
MLLDVENLSTYFFLEEGELKAVDDMSFSINEQETVALVGESGCGKSIAALSIINLVSSPGRIVGGNIFWRGKDMLGMDNEKLRKLRGKEIGMVYQEPGAALNPVYTIGSQISEVIQLHRGLTKHKADAAAVKLLGDTGIPEPEKRAKSYPFELSGGMRQRAVIAIATSGRPKLLIADEPTTALDVTVQAEILDLLRDLQRKYEMAILLITHDLGIVAEMAQRVMVMYTGKLFEIARAEDLFKNPRHPYTIGLLDSVPRFRGKRKLISGIPGNVPDFLKLPSGCTFHPRCNKADDVCETLFPPMREITYGRHCACLRV